MARRFSGRTRRLGCLVEHDFVALVSVSRSGSRGRQPLGRWLTARLRGLSNLWTVGSYLEKFPLSVGGPSGHRSASER
jgi:hypothetical protein